MDGHWSPLPVENDSEFGSAHLDVQFGGEWAPSDDGMGDVEYFATETKTCGFDFSGAQRNQGMQVWHRRRCSSHGSEFTKF